MIEKIIFHFITEGKIVNRKIASKSTCDLETVETNIFQPLNCLSALETASEMAVGTNVF